MSGTHRRDVRRAVLNRRLVGAGVAGVAAVFAVAPFAHADPTGADSASGPSAPSAASSPSAPGAPNHAPAKVQPKAAETGSSTSTDDPVQPNFGIQKIRIGVQVKDGSWVPDGTTTAGSELTIVDTGPAPEGEDRVPSADVTTTTTCTTLAPDPDPAAAVTSPTYCRFDRPKLTGGAASTKLAATDQPNPLDNPEDFYRAESGHTVTITQTTVEPNLIIDSVSQTFNPCDPGDNDFDLCDAALAMFNDPGLPPKAVNDSATTASGKSVDIDVTVNDSTKGAPTTVTVTTDPAHGTAKVLDTAAPAAANARAVSAAIAKIRYTPNAGFSGTDSFKYTITTPNGSSTATVTVTVPAAVATQSPTTAPTSTAVTGPIASTGAPTESIIELGGLLLAVGGAATALGRRRYIARHVGRS